MPSAASEMPDASLYGQPHLPDLVLFLSACLLAAAFGQWMMVVPGVTISFWPPNGVVLAVLLTHPRRTWPWWLGVAAIAELLGNLLWFHNPAVPAAGFAAANMAEVLAAALPLAALFGSPLRRIETLQQVLAFLIIGVVMAPAVGAVLGAAIVALAGKDDFGLSVQLWWLGDATGTLVAMPLTLSVINAWREKALPGPGRTAEAAVIGTALSVPAIWVFRNGLDYEFLLFVPILWASIRFEMRGAVFSMLVILVALAVFSHETPMLPGDAIGRHARVQLFLMVAATTGLVTAVIIRQYRKVTGDLGLLNTQLEQRVQDGTRDRDAAETRFRATFENAAVGLAIVNPDGIVVRANDCLCRMLGFPPHGIDGIELDRFTHPDEVGAGHAALERLRHGGVDSYDMEKRYVARDGEVVWVHTAVSCVRRADGRIDYLIKIIQDISARKRADTARQMLLYEVSHRSKNLLALIQAIARQTAARSADDFVSTFRHRLQALGSNQDLLVQNNWEQVGLGELVRAQLQHFEGMAEHFDISGPEVQLSARAAQAIGMALHELGTNAAKYGSLSGEGIGKVSVAWTMDGEEFGMSWTETGGPPMRPPGQAGFGTAVIDRVLRDTLDGCVSMDYPPEGFMWRVRCKTSALRDLSETA